MTHVFLVLSTGRCGTQWLADTLRTHHGDRLAVTHEPLGARYGSARFFRAHDRLDEFARQPGVSSHLAWVESLDRPYLETGWPLYSAVPVFERVFGERLRVIHLTRHLVPTALSHMVHQTYSGSPRRDAYTEVAVLDPWSPGVLQRDYRARWQVMDPYERCLFWCAEVHAYALELERSFPGRWLRLRYEDLFGDGHEALSDLVSFLGLRFDRDLVAETRRRKDRWHHRNDIAFDWKKIERHPLPMTVLHSLGYSLAGIEDGQLERRYLGTPSQGS